MSSYIFETIEHGIKCPAKVFVTSIDNSAYHWHYDYELILVLKGEVQVKTSQGQVHLRAGDIYLLNSIEVHELSHLEKTNICVFMQLNQQFFLDYKNINGLFYFHLNSTLNSKEPKNGLARYKVLAAKICLEDQKESPNMYRLNSYIYSLVADFFDYLIYDIHQRSSAMSSVEDIEQLMQIINYLQVNFGNVDVLSDICKVFGMSNKTLYRFIKKYIGLSPTELILNSRINASKEMLRLTDKSVPYIATDCGFGAENTFYRVFKKKVGVTPSEYRKKVISLKSDYEIKGYLSFNQGEAIRLLKDIIKENEHDEI